MLRIGRVPVEPPLILAPMAGITDRDFRLLIRRIGGCGLVSMEFISSEGLIRQRPSTLKMLHFVDEERPIAIQIYGSDPLRMAEAAKVVEAMGADLCDINMGCPANKVLKGCAGAALTADLPRAAGIVRAVRAAVRTPLTVKFRLGVSDDSKTFLDLGRACQEEGADAVTLHPRTARQQFNGHSDWDAILELKQVLSIPVVGNGDVTTPEQALEMFRRTGCDAVMIGRGGLGNPWIFREAAALLRGEMHGKPALAERHALMRSHFDEVVRREDGRTALHKLRKFTGWYTHGLPDGRRLRRKLSEVASAQELMGAVEDYFVTQGAA
ncbi:MAG: tRNA dihydrouridine synthase DusB [Acidobacteriia bacterium]|nr:tRNA dihydrouridine synthase DusB [Terriglobia bacterium]